jgi:GT2 family glycosyltransferase
MEIEKLYVIIVTYNGKQWYDRCFQSLRQSSIPVQIVVVDNASTDNTVSYIHSEFPEVYLIESKINLGFGQGNNKGLRYALDQGVEYVFLLNQDAWIEPYTLSELIRVHKENTEYGILSPMHLNAKKTSIENGLMHYIADYRITTSNLINDLYFGRTRDIYETQYVNAAAWLLPRKTLETVGGFDPIFFHYGEDDNYMLRIKYHGLKIGICPEISICHDTESHLIRNEQTQQTARKNLLVDLTDINRSEGINDSIIYYFQKAFLKALKLNFASAKHSLLNGIYIVKMKKRILDSKIQNRKKGSWL